MSQAKGFHLCGIVFSFVWGTAFLCLAIFLFTLPNARWKNATQEICDVNSAKLIRIVRKGNRARGRNVWLLTVTPNNSSIQLSPGSKYAKFPRDCFSFEDCNNTKLPCEILHTQPPQVAIDRNHHMAIQIFLYLCAIFSYAVTFFIFISCLHSCCSSPEGN